MAKLASITLILTILCFLLPTQDVYARKQGTVVTEEETSFLCKVSLGKEKVAKLHFYVQDRGVNHPNTTTYEVARASITETSTTGFGIVRVVDDLITAEADDSSQPIGRMQGLITKSDLSVVAMALNVNILFTTGRYADNTLSILDRRELAVAGGTGKFRFAHGYAIQTTDSFGANVLILEFHTYITYNADDDDDDDVEIVEM